MSFPKKRAAEIALKMLFSSVREHTRASFAAPPLSQRYPLTFLSHAMIVPREWGQVFDMRQDPTTKRIKILACRKVGISLQREYKLLSLGVVSLAAYYNLILGGVVGLVASGICAELYRRSSYEVIVGCMENMRIDTRFSLNSSVHPPNLYFTTDTNTISVSTVSKIRGRGGYGIVGFTRQWTRDGGTGVFLEINIPIDQPASIEETVIDEAQQLRMSIRYNSLEKLINQDEEEVGEMDTNIIKWYLEQNVIPSDIIASVESRRALYACGVRVVRQVARDANQTALCIFKLEADGNVAIVERMPLPWSRSIDCIAALKSLDSSASYALLRIQRKFVVVDLACKRLSPALDIMLNQMIDAGTTKGYFQENGGTHARASRGISFNMIHPQRCARIVKNLRTFCQVDCTD